MAPTKYAWTHTHILAPLANTARPPQRPGSGKTNHSPPGIDREQQGEAVTMVTGGGTSAAPYVSGDLASIAEPPKEKLSPTLQQLASTPPPFLPPRRPLLCCH